MARIYVASSWKNGNQPLLVDTLRRCGHEVYDFRNPNGRHDRNVWDSVTSRQCINDSYHQGLLMAEQFASMLEDEEAIARFEEHRQAMLVADTCILLLPAGRSAHIEAGFMCGLGKHVYVLQAGGHIKPELMYRLTDGYLYQENRLLEALDRQDIKEMPRRMLMRPVNTLISLIKKLFKRSK